MESNIKSSDLINLPATPAEDLHYKMILIDIKHAHEQLQLTEILWRRMENEKRQRIGNIIQSLKDSADYNLYFRFNS
jgi:hypothetical protein